MTKHSLSAVSESHWQFVLFANPLPCVGIAPAPGLAGITVRLLCDKIGRRRLFITMTNGTLL